MHARLAAWVVIAATWQLVPVAAANAADTPAIHATCTKSSAAGDPAADQSGELAPRLKRADALIDQGCYKDAAAVLEAAASAYPNSAEVAGKLRNVRSMLTEDTYIRDLNQVEDAAKLQHSELRCRKFADLEACNESLKATPNDASLLQAKADALLQAGHAADAVVAYRRAAQLSPGDDSLKMKLAEAERQIAVPVMASAAPQAPAPMVAATPQPHSASIRFARNTELHRKAVAVRSDAQPSAPAPTLASTASSTVYSNDAPAGRSN